MKNFIKISSVIFYILLTQVYPGLHWHAHEHHDEVELTLSIHPPELPVDEHDQSGQHDHRGDHDHEKTHFSGNWDYTFQSRTLRINSTVQQILAVVDADPGLQIYIPLQEEQPSNFHHDYISRALSQRAPPLYC